MAKPKAMALEVDLEAHVGWAASGAVCRRGTRGSESQSPGPSHPGHPGSGLGHLVSPHRPRRHSSFGIGRRAPLPSSPQEN